MYAFTLLDTPSTRIQNYWVFGLCPSSGTLEARKHNVSETGSVSVLSEGEETPTLLGVLHAVIPLPYFGNKRI
jgi:hypothetical protein